MAGDGALQTKVEQPVLSFEPLLLKDVRSLLRCGLLQGTVTGVKDYLGKTQRLAGVLRYVLWDDSSRRMHGVRPAVTSDGDDARDALLLFEIHPDRGAPADARIYLFWNPDFQADEEQVFRFLQREIRRVLMRGHMRRYTLILPQDSASGSVRTERLCHALSFKLEAVLQDYFHSEDGVAPIPAAQWVWLLRDPAHGQCFFIPFGEGLLLGRGNERGVAELAFRNYGSQCKSERVYLWAHSYGWADEKGRYCALKGDEPVQEPMLKGAMKTAFVQLREYLKGERRELDFPCMPTKGSEFQEEVWAYLRTIPYGETRSYLEVAKAIIGSEGDKARRICRAVGAACAANPLCVIVPCHRVVGSDLSLTGFSGGVNFKGHLLNLELWGQRPGERA